MNKSKKLTVKNTQIVLFTQNEQDYISLTDIAKYKDSARSDYIIQNWMRNQDTIIFLGLWEKIHNPEFKSIEFDGFKNRAGSNSFSLTPKRWINSTNAIKKHLIPPQISVRQSNMTYASEADVLNKALFGLTAKEWRKTNPKKEGNIRDYATTPQLVCLSNLESLNAEYIRQAISRPSRLKTLNQIAIVQMKSLLNLNSVKKLKLNSNKNGRRGALSRR